MDIERLISELIRKDHNIAFVVNKLKEKRYPSDNPKKLLSMIVCLSSFVKDEMLDKYKKGKFSKQDFGIQLKFVLIFIKRLGGDLRFVERSSTLQTPWSLVRPFEKIGQQIHNNSIFVIRPQWNYNYTIREMVSSYKQHLGYSGNPLNSPFFHNDQIKNTLEMDEHNDIQKIEVIGFPYLDRLNALQHTLIGHELGHPIEKEYFQQEDKQQLSISIIKDVISELNLDPDINKWDLYDQRKFNDLRKNVLGIRNRALAEIICDLVCTNLFGLATLFAFEDFVSSHELDGVNTDAERHYPPSRFRLRTIYNELVDPSHNDFINDFILKGEFEDYAKEAIKLKIESIEDIISKDSDEVKINQNSVSKIAYKYVESSIENASEFVRDRLNTSGYNLTNLLGKSNQKLLSRLENWITPDCFVDEKNEEVNSDIFSILNIGWIRWICSFSTIKDIKNYSSDNNDYLQNIDALNRLLLKAIEYSDIRTTYSLEEDKF